MPCAALGLIDGMTETIDELGPVDYIVVEFPGNKFNGEIAPALGDLVDRDLVRVLDLVFVTKDADGGIEGFELGDIDEGIAGEIEKLEIDIAHMLSEDDVISLAAAMEPGSSRRCSSGRTSGPHRSRRPCVTPAVSWSRAAGSRSRRSSAPSRTKTKEPDMPLAARRAARRGVVGAPVARTAAVVGTAAVVAHGVDRRSDRREDRRDRR